MEAYLLYYYIIMFIVIEGIDGAGCETQGKNLIKMLMEAGKKASLIKYPDYERNVGKLIKEFLYQNKNLTPEQQFLLYTIQFVMDKEMLSQRRKDEIIIADRYFTTTLCYQTLLGIDMNIALDYAKNFKIEVPDIVFYLNVDPDIAIKRKSGENKEKNRTEKDFELTKRTSGQYKMLVEKQIWTKWVKIDGNKGIEEITQNIYNEIIKI